MSINAIANTNLSSVSDPVGNRGNYPSGVYTFDMGTAPVNAGANQVFDSSVLSTAKSAQTVHNYVGKIAAGPNPGTIDIGQSQLVTLTFETAHGWTNDTHDLHINIARKTTGALTTAAPLGACSGGSFSANSITFVRTAPALAGATARLAEAIVTVTVRKRGVAKTA
jgi:hypothetical protein